MYLKYVNIPFQPVVLYQEDGKEKSISLFLCHRRKVSKFFTKRKAHTYTHTLFFSHIYNQLTQFQACVLLVNFASEINWFVNNYTWAFQRIKIRKKTRKMSKLWNENLLLLFFISVFLTTSTISLKATHIISMISLVLGSWYVPWLCTYRASNRNIEEDERKRKISIHYDQSCDFQIHWQHKKNLKKVNIIYCTRYKHVAIYMCRYMPCLYAYLTLVCVTTYNWRLSFFLFLIYWIDVKKSSGNIVSVWADDGSVLRCC